MNRVAVILGVVCAVAVSAAALRSSAEEAAAAPAAAPFGLAMPDADQPISIRADELEATSTGGERHLIFTANVRVDQADVRITMERYGRRLMDRFLDFGIPGHKTIFVHGVHFEPREMDLMRSTDSVLVNNPESNMNNGLGVCRHT